MSTQNETKNAAANAALIVAGGVGLRAAGGSDDSKPKQYRLLGAQSVILKTIKAFTSHPGIDVVRPVIAAGAEEFYEHAMAGYEHPKLLPPVSGGISRQASVRNGLLSFQNINIQNVLIHDAARPFVTINIIDNVLAGLESTTAVIAGTPLVDSLKRVSEDTDITNESISRNGLWAAQTPQGFRFSEIADLHEKFADADCTDDASLFEKAGRPVHLCRGDRRNIKLTSPEDFEYALEMLDSSQYEFRTGQGIDVHRFAPGEAVTLCGVNIPHSHKLSGHSDADVAMHALTDAILGAVSEGDIGVHFPPGDAEWQGAPSRIFLEHAVKLLARHDATLVHCDVTIMCEAPKISPHREAMITSLSAILGSPASRISVKATTTEKLGFTGRREGIMASAVATVRLPLEMRGSKL